MEEEGKSQKRRISIVIPLYNERDNILPLYERIKEALEPEDLDFEVLFIDDGSTDGSTLILDEVSNRDKRVKVVKFIRNYGQTAAISAGFKYSSSDIIVTLDADLQNDPMDISAMLKKLDEGYDLVCGWRKERKDPLLSKKIPSIIANKIISNLTKVYLHDYGCTLKVYKKSFLKDLPLYGEMHRFIPIYLTWAGAKIIEVPVRHNRRVAGRSKYGLNRTFKVLLDLITMKFLRDYFVTPIYFFGISGFILFFFGVISCAMAIFMKYYYGTWIHKNPFLLLAVMFFIISVLMFHMGIIADILIRMNFEIQKKEPYRVKSTTNIDT